MATRAWAVVLVVASALLAGCAKPVEPLEPTEGLAPPASGVAGSTLVEGAFRVAGEFRVTSTRVTVAPADASASGTADAPVALASPMARASTRLVADEWVLAVTMEEADAAGGPGRYAASLDWDGVDRGVVHVARLPNASAGAVELRWGLGHAIAPSAVYVVTVRVAPAGADEGAVLLQSHFDDDFAWVTQDGVVNPPLRGRAGDDVRLVATHGGDPAPHNLVVLDAAGRVVVGPTADAAAAGERVALDWTPSAAGEFTYACRYHAAMRGTISVVA